MKQRGEKIVMLTAYDATMAEIEDEAGIEIILVGDSASNVVAGYETTLPIGMPEMLYHTSCVARGVKKALVIADMPFLSFQISPEKALENAGRFLKEANANGVKLEGGLEIADTVRKITSIGIPVIGHIGLTPQSINRFGGYLTQGKTPAGAERLKKDALALQEAGAFLIVLEKIEANVAGEISRSLKIPTIGCGSGPQCDGQVVVVYDMLGLFRHFKPKFVRRYLELADEVSDAFKKYREDIKSGDFPNKSESF